MNVANAGAKAPGNAASSKSERFSDVFGRSNSQEPQARPKASSKKMSTPLSEDFCAASLIARASDLAAVGVPAPIDECCDGAHGKRQQQSADEYRDRCY